MYANVIRNALKIAAVCAVALPCGAYANQLGSDYSPYHPSYNNNGAYAPTHPYYNQFGQPWNPTAAAGGQYWFAPGQSQYVQGSGYDNAGERSGRSGPGSGYGYPYSR